MWIGGEQEVGRREIKDNKWKANLKKRTERDRAARGSGKVVRRQVPYVWYRRMATVTVCKVCMVWMPCKKWKSLRFHSDPLRLLSPIHID